MSVNALYKRQWIFYKAGKQSLYDTYDGVKTKSATDLFSHPDHRSGISLCPNSHIV
jgi:hypothetical protein